MKKVAIVSTGHPPFDERIYNKIGISLKKLGYSVSIIITNTKIVDNTNSIKIIGDNFGNRKNFKKKFLFIINQLKQFNPDIIINAEPVPVIISFLYTLIQKNQKPAKIIYDVTEWYPENIYLKYKGIKRILLFILGHIINFFATNLSDYLFIGEGTKLNRYRKYSPRKKFSIISYYPILEYYKPSTKKIENDEVILAYAGVISVSRGLDIYYNIIKELKEKLKNYKIGFILAGRFENINEKIYLTKFSELQINFSYFDWTDYKYFSNYLEPAHICLDIRPRNNIYERSLPIKIFDYMAIGKAIVASDYQPIREIFKIANCGILVNPEDMNQIINEILALINNKDKIVEYGQNGRIAVEKFYNWTICETELKLALEKLNL